MDSIPQRQVLGAVIVLIGAVLVLELGPSQMPWALSAIALVAGLGAVWVAGSAGQGSGGELESLGQSVRRVLEGKRPEAPPGSSVEVLRLYDDLGELRDALGEQKAAADEQTARVAEVERQLAARD